MKIDIWSDVMCPFCYIGKRKFENALEKFAHKEQVEIEWHSFQLDPDAEYKPGVNVYSYLAERKGQSYDWSVRMHAQVVQMAKEAGLEYNFDKAVIANSFDAHRLIQLAKKHNLGDAAEERLFHAYFTEGINISDHESLVKLGSEIGLPEKEVKEMLESDVFSNEVNKDILTAHAYRIQGVPFFVIDNKYGVSGAQPSEVFLKTLEGVWQESVKTETGQGESCDVDGNC